MARWMQHVIRKKWRKICTHQPGRSCLDVPTWQWSRTQDQVHLLLVPAEKSEGSGAAISVSWPQYHWNTLGISNIQFMQDSPRLYRNWRLVEEWAALPSEKIKSLFHNYHKRLQAVTDVKGATHHIKNEVIYTFDEGHLGSFCCHCDLKRANTIVW